MSGATNTQDAALAALAVEAGLCASWEDVHGTSHAVSPDTLRTVLERLGLPCASRAQIDESRQRIAASCNTRALRTANVFEPLRCPTALRPGAAFVLSRDDGERVEGRLIGAGDAAWLPGVEDAGDYTVECGDTQFDIAIAPHRCHGVDDALGRAQARAWGAVAQLYGLRTREDGVLGSYDAAAALAENLAGRGAAALALSPTHAGFAARPDVFSPYAPSSRAHYNVLYAAASDGGAATQQTPELVDWPAASRERLALLRDIFERTSAKPCDGFEQFLQERGEALTAHARFEAIDASCAAQGERDWRQWPTPLRDPSHGAVAAFAAEHADAVRWHQWLQWRADAGLRDAQARARNAGMAIGLIADFAVGSHPCGSDAWSWREEMLDGLQIGAPGDLLAPQGQCWGLAALSPMAMRTHGFAAWRRMLRATTRHAGGVRIDHVMGLQRLWLVPDGASADQGVYLRYPVDDLLRLIALESAKQRCIVIGEDLGTVDPALRTLLGQRGVLGMDVLPFMQEDDVFTEAKQWRRSAVAMTSTHDLAPVAGWWSGRDLALRARIGDTDAAAQQTARKQRAAERGALWARIGGETGLPEPSAAEPATAVAAAIGFVASTPSPLALIPLEDLLACEDLPNLPGTTDEHPNWRRRAPRPVPDLIDAAAERRVQRLAAQRSAP